MSLARRIVAGVRLPDESDAPRWVAFAAVHGISALSDALSIIDSPAKRAQSERFERHAALLTAGCRALESGDPEAIRAAADAIDAFEIEVRQ